MNWGYMALRLPGKLYVASRKMRVSLKRAMFELATCLPSMAHTSWLLIVSGLIFKKRTWDELSLYWQTVDEGFDNEAQKRKVIRYGKTSLVLWPALIGFLWIYYVLSQGTEHLLASVQDAGMVIVLIPTILLFVLQALAGVVIFIAGMMICCIIGILINVFLALIRSRINFYVALAVGLGNTVLLFIYHYTIPIFNIQSTFLPVDMRADYLEVISSYEFLISAIVGLFAMIGIGSIHAQFLKTDGMFRLFKINLRESKDSGGASD